MRSILRTLLVSIGAVVLTTTAGMSAQIQCGTLGTAYDKLFTDASARTQAIVAAFKALPPSATDAQKDGIRKKFCAIAGEILGLYKIVGAVANDCATQGEQNSELVNVIQQQRANAESGIKATCE